MASAYLTKTFSSGGNQRIWTLSFWVKLNRGSGDDSYILSYAQSSGSNPRGEITFRSDANGNNFRVGFNPTGSSWTNCDVDNRKFRDYSAWYHAVVAVDTTQGTASNRVKVYINGEQQTVSTQPSQNFDTGFNHTHQQSYGRYENSDSSYLDGLLSHIHFIDGTQYSASDFGQTDSTSGIWKPKTSPSVTYGTNGYFLSMEDSSNFGDDTSGNTNDFTVNGTITQTEDSPSNNFATLNTLTGATHTGLTIANGNLTIDGNTGTAWRSLMATLGVSSGKWYYEVKVKNLADNVRIGLIDVDDMLQANGYFNSKARGYAYNNDGQKSNNNSSASYGNSYTTNDIIGIAMDLDNGKLYFSKNGTYQNSGDPTSGSTGTGSAYDISSGYTYAPCIATYQSTDKLECNFGNGRFGTTALASSNSDSAGLGLFEYSVPSGYYSLCTKNIKNYG
jgi:hypothetical protein